MSDSSQTLPSARSWRDIPQEVQPRAMSKSGRRRHALAVAKTLGGLVLGGAAIWAAVEVYTVIDHNPKRLATATQAVPVRTLRLTSDGPLNEAWLTRQLALPKGVSLVELDLAKAQERLLACSQVRAAVLTKSFPDALHVTINERVPVARLMAQSRDGQLREFLVARDGIVFEGEGHAADTRGTLPWLDLGDARLMRRGDGFAPIGGMDVVAELLARAHLEADHLYRTFEAVSLARFATDHLIEVRTSEIRTVVFTTKDDFFRQLAKLDKIRDELRPSAVAPMTKVDLSLGSHVPVVVGALPAPTPSRAVAAPKPVADPATKPVLPAFPNFLRASTSP
ncbi:MAG: FtsQ-type POTRA domain-containing protein [Opitutae bacterium]|nr:FtsQ-type POTRA domain-containing protein [Opitutae bacterium]